MKTLKLVAVLILLLSNTKSFSQSRHDQLQMREKKAGFYDKDIMTGVQQYEEKKVEKPSKPIFKFDINKFGWYPKSVDEFTTWWKNIPISQGNSNTCWSYSTTSFLKLKCIVNRSK
ncbi:MAG: hypothetical protein IPK10_08380 [Bacteroidetes bacterium]|nr:hypothetical protein [Bacteroidota bacterium]